MNTVDITAPVRDWLPITCYPGYTPGLPDIWLGRLLAALARPVPRDGAALNFRAGPDAATAQPSRLAQGFIGLYIPPEAGWPWLTVVGLAHAPAGEAAALGLARGAYAFEAFDAEPAALDHLARLGAMMPGCPVVMPDRARLS